MSQTNDDAEMIINIDSEIPWESELADLLEELSSAQAELITLLKSKGECIRQQDHEGLAELAPKEEG